jgi:methionyl-tRNA synthetase
MKCKTCAGKGMLLKPSNLSEDEVEMVVVTCDCCGGWSFDGMDCENCQADAEGRSRPIVWISEEEYPQALKEYQNKIEQTKGEDNEASNVEE